MAKHRTLPHRIERTRNKHSRAVLKGNTIVIRLARGLSKNEEQQHIHDLLKRMHEHVLKEREKTLIDPFRPLLEGAERMHLRLPSGKAYRLVLFPGKRTRVTRSPDGFCITISPNIRRAGLHRLLWNIIARTELASVEHFVHDLNRKTYRVRTSGIRIRFMTSQWGSCSQRGVIMLNAALLLMPPSILEYVIIHELAHRKVKDHSDRYWRWVAWAMPGYASARERLKRYRLPSMSA